MVLIRLEILVEWMDAVCVVIDGVVGRSGLKINNHNQQIETSRRLVVEEELKFIANSLFSVS